MKITYLAHDVSDAAIAKRTAMLSQAGTQIYLAGFRRIAEPIATLPGASSITDLGRTRNASFINRIVAVLKVLIRIYSYKALFKDADIIIARNLEMLVIAVTAKALFYQKKAPIVIYECLDIHRMMLKENIVGKVLRGIEGYLSHKADGLITSSPAFVSDYFEQKSRVNLPVKLIENKVYMSAPYTRRDNSNLNIETNNVWKIGWFGVLRCRQSLAILSKMAEHSHGKIKVIIRGKPAYDQIPDFDHIVNNTDGLEYKGTYKYPDDLAEIYGDIHFNWAIDKYEDGQNSLWLLPNRLYEGSLYGAIPVAEKHVETGAYLDRYNIGVTLPQPLDHNAFAFFDKMTTERYKTLKEGLMSLPDTHWIFQQKECDDILAWMKSL